MAASSAPTSSWIGADRGDADSLSPEGSIQPDSTNREPFLGGRGLVFLNTDKAEIHFVRCTLGFGATAQSFFVPYLAPLPEGIRL